MIFEKLLTQIWASIHVPDEKSCSRACVGLGIAITQRQTGFPTLFMHNLRKSNSRGMGLIDHETPVKMLPRCSSAFRALSQAAFLLMRISFKYIFHLLLLLILLPLCLAIDRGPVPGCASYQSPANIPFNDPMYLPYTDLNQTWSPVSFDASQGMLPP